MEQHTHIPNTRQPDRIASYFRMEWKALLAVTVSGMVYNIGLLAGPWFEGRLAQTLLDILEGRKFFGDMVRLTVLYVTVIAAVQLARYIKRLYVRVFANNVNRSMKHVLYGNLVRRSKRELETEGAGSMMTKAISDVDACAEGMRKFTTEIFDTGVALLGYIGLLIWYDWRLAFLCLIFPPFSYMVAEKMKNVVQKSGAAYKESAGRLSAATLDRAAGALTYRVNGCEKERDRAYETQLADYEKRAVYANIWVSAMPPLYQIISMVGTLFILYFGAKNVAQMGWKSWDIAAFTTFLSCFIKLSVKSAKAAKLFNSVHKAEVSWKRIKPLMQPVPEEVAEEKTEPAELVAENLGFRGLILSAKPGEIIGVTGPVACGKSTLGRAFLCEEAYPGSIRFDGQELSEMSGEKRSSIVGYMGHDCELFNDSIRNNILLGKEADAETLLRAVCLEDEVKRMPDGIDTLVGSGGVRLSGGQQARLALARTLAHKKPLLILDDPFSALDKKTEKAVFENLKAFAPDSIILLISHRLYLFPEMNQVIWMEGGRAQASTHEALMRENQQYAGLYRTQCQEGGGPNEA